MSTTDRRDAVTRNARNRKQTAVVIQRAYPGLTVEEVRRVLRAAERVKNSQARYGLIHHMNGRTLSVEPLDFKK